MTIACKVSAEVQNLKMKTISGASLLAIMIVRVSGDGVVVLVLSCSLVYVAYYFKLCDNLYPLDLGRILLSGKRCSQND